MEKAKKRMKILMILMVFLFTNSAFALVTNYSNTDETIIINWPDTDGRWIKLFEEEDDHYWVSQFALYNKDDKHLETVYLKIRKSMQLSNLNEYAKKLFQITKKNDSRAKFQLNKKKLNIKYDNCLYMISARDRDGKKESQVCVLIQGKKAIYEIQRAIKKPRLSKKDLVKISRFFETIKINPSSKEKQ